MFQKGVKNFNYRKPTKIVVKRYRIFFFNHVIMIPKLRQ